MPRDLFSSESKEGMPLTASPESQGRPGDATTTGQDGYGESILHRDEFSRFSSLRNMRAQGNEMNKLHPYVQTLSISNLEGCVALENVTFPEHERCSKEKFMYRLTTCPELSLGLFSTAAPDGVISSSPTYPFARAPDSTTPEKKGVLIAHVIATKCTAPSVTDSSMEIPQDWKENPSSSEARGHQEHGRTLAIHSLATLPGFQNKGLGKTVMKSYIQRMESSGLADQIALLAHDHLVKYYEALGFRNRGKSEAKFGGGEWNDMVYEIINHAPGS